MVAVSVSHIFLTPLKRIPIAGGDVLHGIKRSDPGFVDFGEAYFSIIESGAVKAWKRHLRMTLNLVVPVGSVYFVFLDAQGEKRTHVAGENSYVRITVPPGIWFGFKGLSPPYSLLMNVADIPHDPAEIERKDVSGFHFDWDIAL
jgi:dTDP-4-dehydrorhamnose 3,5-epimerase